MVKLIEQLVYWVTFGPLKGYRTMILQGLIAAWGALWALGVLQTYGVDDKSFGAVLALLTAAAAGTAAAHTV